MHLRPGDILWNPSFYWHAVKNPTDSIGVGYRWLPPLYCLRMAPLYFILDLMATNPSFRKSMKLYKQDFNLIQLAETGRLEQYLNEPAQTKAS